MSSYSTETTVSEFHINKLTKAEYIQAVSNGEITTPDISIITDDEGYLEAIDILPNFFVIEFKGVDNKIYVFKEVDTVNSKVVWSREGTDFYTSGTTEPVIGDTVYSDSSCTVTETTISSSGYRTLVGKMYHYIGTTTGVYHQGYFYKGVSNGQTPPTYSWEQFNVQPDLTAITGYNPATTQTLKNVNGVFTWVND